MSARPAYLMTESPHRFPAPWDIEEYDRSCFIVLDNLPTLPGCRTCSVLPNSRKETRLSRGGRAENSMLYEYANHGAKRGCNGHIRAWRDHAHGEGNGGRTLHGFNAIGVDGRSVVTFNYETEEEAAAARE